MDIDIRPVNERFKKDASAVLSKPLGFGQVFADRMLVRNYFSDNGWEQAAITDFQPIALSPAALVLHYAQEIFEGLKAYHLVDGGVAMFRPEKNAERMNRSAKRMVMPEMSVEEQVRLYDAIVKELKDWIPTNPGYSLYLRPTLIGTTPILGVQPSKDYLYYIICSPVAGYFARGFEPVKVTTSGEFIRAAKGGTGEAKAGANYAASLYAAMEAKKKGFDQVVWLDAIEHRYIEEMGGMNVFFVYGDTLRTCPLTGTILPGITRNSIFTLAEEFGLKVVEEALDVEEACRGIDKGDVTEVFACGTAAVVTAISHFDHKGTMHEVGDGTPGNVTTKLYETLTGIQSGKIEDKYGWVHRVE